MTYTSICLPDTLIVPYMRLSIWSYGFPTSSSVGHMVLECYPLTATLRGIVHSKIIFMRVLFSFVSCFSQQYESNPLCHRLKLADLTSVVMQRFTKYPLLLEGILKVTNKESCPTDYSNLATAVDRSRLILEHINQSVMEFENTCAMYMLQSRLDMKNMDKLVGHMANYRSLDISTRELLHRGDLKWRQKGKLMSVDALLFADVLVLLEANEDKTRHCLRVREEFIPILPLADLLPPREVASDKDHKSFLLVSLNRTGSKMFEFSAASCDASSAWRVKLSDAIANAKGGLTDSKHPSSLRNINAFLLRTSSPQLHGTKSMDSISSIESSPMPESADSTFDVLPSSSRGSVQSSMSVIIHERK